jgi:hypothetical protein
MASNIAPPKHKKITILESQKEIWIVGSIDKAFAVTPDEAVKLGLALMETGLYLKGSVAQPSPNPHDELKAQALQLLLRARQLGKCPVAVVEQVINEIQD